MVASRLRQQLNIPDTKHAVLVDYLYGILPSRVPGDLEFETARMSEYLPSGFIVIGHDPGGNAFLLATRGKRRGSIYFWDKRGLISDGTNGGNTYRIASNTASFLRSLYASG